MTDRTREGLGAFAAPSAPPAPPTDEPTLPDPPPVPPDEGEDDEAIVQVPESASGWYRVFTPNSKFVGSRLGHAFIPESPGETCVHTNEYFLSSVPGGKQRRTRVVELFARDLGYRVEPIPVGVPPVPLSTLASAGISAGVANS